MSSARLEDLKEELTGLRDKITLKLRQGIGQGTLNNLFSDGDEILKQIRMEVDQAPFIARKEMNLMFAELDGSWSSFKNNCRSNPGLVMGGPSIADESSAQNFDLNLQLAKGITVLERTSDSLYRASQVAKETEQIGTEVLTELGGQRESLLRTRIKLDSTNQDLKRSHLILRAMHRRVLTNKFLLYLIILIEITIFVLLAYYKFIKKEL